MVSHTWERRIVVTYLPTPLATILPTVSIPCIHRCSAKSPDFAMLCAIAPAAFQARLVMCFACFLCFAALRLLRRLRAGGSASGAAGLKAVRLPRLSLLGRLFR